MKKYSFLRRAIASSRVSYLFLDDECHPNFFPQLSTRDFFFSHADLDWIHLFVESSSSSGKCKKPNLTYLWKTEFHQNLWKLDFTEFVENVDNWILKNMWNLEFYKQMNSVNYRSYLRQWSNPIKRCNNSREVLRNLQCIFRFRMPQKIPSRFLQSLKSAAASAPPIIDISNAK